MPGPGGRGDGRRWAERRAVGPARARAVATWAPARAPPRRAGGGGRGPRGAPGPGGGRRHGPRRPQLPPARKRPAAGPPRRELGGLDLGEPVLDHHVTVARGLEGVHVAAVAR